MKRANNKDLPELSANDASRFWSKVNKALDSGGCWIWLACRSRLGYGAFRLKINGVAKMVAAHRIAYRIGVGPIAEGLSIDHLCRNPGCVNPTHLEAVTHKENVRRGLRTKCRHDDSVQRYADGRCALCSRDKCRRWQSANAERRREYKRAMRAKRKEHAP